MTVPGTFKNRPPAPRRMPDVPEVLAGAFALGALHAELWAVGECSVIVSREPFRGLAGEKTYRWHLSIAHSSRYPSWDEIKTAAYGIPLVSGVMLAQILSPGDGSEWVNVHDNCFHLYEVHDPVLAGLGS